MSERKESVDLATLQAQLDVSVGIARTLVTSWLPPPKPDEKEDNNDGPFGATARPAGLGLGAKFITHAEATRHAFEARITHKILGNNTQKRPREDFDYEDKQGSRYLMQKNASKPSQMHKPGKDEDENDHEDSRVLAVGKKAKDENIDIANVEDQVLQQKVGGGDYYSMYLSKKNKRRKREEKEKKKKQNQE